jgi:hypothetical protein
VEKVRGILRARSNRIIQINFLGRTRALDTHRIGCLTRPMKGPPQKRLAECVELVLRFLSTLWRGSRSARFRGGAQRPIGRQFFSDRHLLGRLPTLARTE